MRKLTPLIVFLISLPLFGQNYFQQEVNYKIDVRLNDKERTLNAYEEIEYINNSSDELSFIYFHLWPNAYSNSNTALGKELGSENSKLDDDKTRGYIDSLDFKVNGKRVEIVMDKEHVDICKVILDTPLKPGDKITITTPFRVKVPMVSLSRMGCNLHSYQISQWYPKPAVYDKQGWHQMPYLNQGEFYSEYGSFDVKISLPKNYVVGATGDLQNKEEIEWLNLLAEKTAKLDSFPITNKTELDSESEYKTLRYKQQNVHDFAWFADKNFYVLKSEVELPYSKRKVDSWVMFTGEKAKGWKKATQYINDAVYYYSKWYGDYPYNHCTAVYGGLGAGGGMEYPNITVIGDTDNDLTLETVIMHEVGHNWFYGILGSNERRYPWIDEGINSFSEARYMNTKYGEEYGFYKSIIPIEKAAEILGIKDYSYLKFKETMYMIMARMGMDQPANLSSEEYTNMNYGGIIYMKTAIVWYYLMEYLGEEEFDRIMQKFYAEWKFKHPYPKDIHEIFETESGKDLSWLFDDLINTTNYVDYKVKRIKIRNYWLRMLVVLMVRLDYML